MDEIEAYPLDSQLSVEVFVLGMERVGMWTLSHMSKAERKVIVGSEVIADTFRPTAIHRSQCLCHEN